MTPQQRFDDLIKLANAPTKEDVATLISELGRAVSKVIAKAQDSMNADMSSNMKECMDMCKAYETALGELKVELSNKVSSGDKKVADEAYKRLNSAIYGLEQQVAAIEQDLSPKLETKWAVVIAELRDKIDLIKPYTLNILDIRNGLEALTEKERLNWTAVQGVIGIHIGTQPPEDKEMLWIDVR